MIENNEWKAREEGSETDEIINYIREKRVHTACDGSKLEDSFRDYFIITDKDKKY